MLETLIELKKDIPVIMEYGEPEKIIIQIVKKYNIDSVYLNTDYTPYSIERDKKISEALTKIKKQFNTYDDIPLNAPTKFKPYKVFTPYYNIAKKNKVSNKPLNPNIAKIIKTTNQSVNINSLLSKYDNKSSKLRQHGGRQEAIKLLKNLKNHKHYSFDRNILSKSTSRLSPYIKFGVLSIREVYREAPTTDFKKELYWRDFYIQIAYHFPNILTYAKPQNFKFEERTMKYDIAQNFKDIKVKWKFNKKLYDAWCNGQTNIPIVDAAINELLQTGYMHNRCRMITASVFTKLFHLDWRLGEQFFAQKLTDYDPCSNNGGWQWASGTGADAQPYFRIFNPYPQAEKYDPQCEYIKKWCPKYKNLSPKDIFNIRSEIFNYEEARAWSIDNFKNAD